MKDIVQKFILRINEQFGADLGIEASVSKQDPYKIEVSLENVEKTDRSARLLINMVDFVKTMVLALA